MPKGKFSNRVFIPVLNNLAALAQWLKPGRLAFRFGQLKYAVEPTAVHVQTETQRIMSDYQKARIERAKEQRAAAQAAMQRGEAIVDQLPEVPSPEIEINKLLDDETTIVYPRLISQADIDAIEANLRPIEPNEKRPHVDFAALIPFMEPQTDDASSAESTEGATAAT